jgi:hypothetical protein
MIDIQILIKALKSARIWLDNLPDPGTLRGSDSSEPFYVIYLMLNFRGNLQMLK